MIPGRTLITFFTSSRLHTANLKSALMRRRLVGNAKKRQRRSPAAAERLKGANHNPCDALRILCVKRRYIRTADYDHVVRGFTSWTPPVNNSSLCLIRLRELNCGGIGEF